MNVLYRNKEVYPQIDDPFRCIDIYYRKACVALWVHPFILYNEYFFKMALSFPSYLVGQKVKLLFCFRVKALA